MSTPQETGGLSTDELCDYFESLSDERRKLVWVRCERSLGGPVDDFEPDDPLLDEVFEAVLADMWAADALERLVALGRLERSVDSAGRLIFCTP